MTLCFYNGIDAIIHHNPNQGAMFRRKIGLTMIKVAVAVSTVKDNSAELIMHKADGYTGSLDSDMIYALTDKWHRLVLTWYGDAIVPVKVETQISELAGGKLIDITAFYKSGFRVNAMMLATEVSE